MVFGSHAKTRAMYSIPPCPSLVASMAAYRRRSFSDSHPKNRCIFPSISAGYSSIPSSWLRGLRRSQDTTAQASREVILNRILSIAAVQSEGRHLTLRHGPAPQANSDYSHYYPRRAAGRVGGLLRYISPSCCPRSLPLDQSATIRNLCTNPSRMRPWSTPLVHGMPKTLSRIFHCHGLQAISIPPVSPSRR